MRFRSLSVELLEKPILFSSFPLRARPVSEPVDTPTESLRAARAEGIDGPLPLDECLVVAALSRPGFCSAR